MRNMIELENGAALDVDEYPLPDGIEDVVLNRNFLAQAMNVSEPTITKWISAGMPVLSRGGNGTSYEFQLSHCYAWRMWQQQEAESTRRRSAEVAKQMAMTFLNHEEGEGDHATMSPKDVREWAEAELARNKAEEQRGDMVRRHRVERLLQTMVSITRDALVGYGDFLEAELGLEPREVDIAQSRADQLLTELRMEIERQIDSVAAEVTPLRTPPAEAV